MKNQPANVTFKAGGKERVLRAIQDGCTTQRDLLIQTGLSRASLNSYLSRLNNTGAIVVEEQTCRDCGHRHARYRAGD